MREDRRHTGDIASIESNLKQCGPLCAKVNDENAWRGMEILKNIYFLQLVLIVLSLRISSCSIASILCIIPKDGDILKTGTVWGNEKAWALAPGRLMVRRTHLYFPGELCALVKILGWFHHNGHHNAYFKILFENLEII